MKLTTFEIIREQVPIEKIRLLAKIEDDELLKSFFAYFVCIAGGAKLVTKANKIAILKEMISRGANGEELTKKLNICKRTLKRIESGTRENS
jgi:hypothetical protein